MTRLLTTFLISIALANQLASAQSWPLILFPIAHASGEEKSADDYRKVLSGKAMKGTYSKGVMSINFLEDGSVDAYTTQSKTSGKWSFDDKGQLCLVFFNTSWTDSCNQIVLDRSKNIMFQSGNTRWFKQIE